MWHLLLLSAAYAYCAVKKCLEGSKGRVHNRLCQLACVNSHLRYTVLHCVFAKSEETCPYLGARASASVPLLSAAG